MTVAYTKFVSICVIGLCSGLYTHSVSFGILALAVSMLYAVVQAERARHGH